MLTSDILRDIKIIPRPTDNAMDANSVRETVLFFSPNCFFDMMVPEP